MCQGTLQRAQWIRSKTEPGKGNLLVPMAPNMAGIPRSRANCTWASCTSLGANDMVRTSFSNR